MTPHALITKYKSLNLKVSFEPGMLVKFSASFYWKGEEVYYSCLGKTLPEQVDKDLEPYLIKAI